MVGITSDPTYGSAVEFSFFTTLSVYRNLLKKLATLRDHYDVLVPSHAAPDEPTFLDPRIVDVYIEGD